MAAVPSSPSPARRPFYDGLRFLVALLFLLTALTAWCKPPVIFVWFLQLGATEYGHWFAAGPLLLVLFRAPRRLNTWGSIAALLALGIFLSTAFRAATVGKNLPHELAVAFGEMDLAEEPFSWPRLWLGSSEEPILRETQIFQQTSEYTLRLDFYRSTDPAPSPCVVMLHTGGWNSGLRGEFKSMNSHLARRGYAVAALDYRFAPRWRWPAQREDVLNALGYLKTHATQLGIDPARLVLLGRSAGGHIAETVAYSAHDPAIRGCIAFYAPADLHFAYQFSDERDILKSPQLLRDFLGGKPQEASANYDSASAIQFVDAHSPPTLLLHGEPDPLVWYRQSERLAAVLETAGVRHLLVTLPWGTHAFDFNFDGPGGQLSTFAVDYFLDRVVGKTPPRETK